MAKKQSVAKLKKKLDTIFSRWLRLSSADHRGVCTCFTCGSEKHWKEIQAGHFMSRKHNATRWHLDNVKPQCVKCNMFSQGEQYKFGQALGKEVAQEMEYLSNTTMKLNAAELEEEIKRYTELFNELT